ncbi:ABC transporter permease [Catenulispora yoronensis]
MAEHAAAAAAVSSPAVPAWTGVALSVSLVLVAVVIAWRQHLGLAREIVIASVRAGVQLLAVGAVLLFLFEHAGLPGGFAWLGVMVVIAGQVAGRRGAGLHRARWVATAAIGGAAAVTLGVLLLFGVVQSEPRVVVPVGGMVVSGSMQAAGVTLARMVAEARQQRPVIEARLALGLSGAEAFAAHRRELLRTSLMPTLDATKVVGLISLPGAMTGLILAGVSPEVAIRYQIVVMYMLVAAAVMAALGAAELGQRMLFTPAHQLR